ncbi:MAG: hypothetical protein U1E17_01005 [Geminicoccaceae bacterium]
MPIAVSCTRISRGTPACPRAPQVPRSRGAEAEDAAFKAAINEAVRRANQRLSAIERGAAALVMAELFSIDERPR